ncbi:MAG: HNH endonuclease [Rhodospirillaceae bacterium]|nr:MAG: HNH endonuclease [Rhodospirillaceae bacterium]
MTAIWFKDDDDGYTNWCKAHERGFVVNADSKPRRKYLVLHKVSCEFLKRPFTGPSYSKFCSDSIDELLAELERKAGARAFSKLCKKCSPLTTE